MAKDFAHEHPTESRSWNADSVKVLTDDRKLHLINSSQCKWMLDSRGYII